MNPTPPTAEQARLQAHRERRADWKRWGPYLSERAWGTVREDYSPNGDAWAYFPHDHARSRVYRWNEDGLAGISDRHQYLCFALALWNEQDPILKERLFGLTNSEGNHGEDVKEVYYYLDNTPTHSYMRMLYKYPQRRFPYEELLAENARRGLEDPEYELWDTGIFAENRYFDVFVEYAKAAEDDILVRITAVNRGPDPAPLHLLPTLWFRNTWRWGYPAGPMGDVPGKPVLQALPADNDLTVIQADHPRLGTFYLYAEEMDHLLFTENETDNQRLFQAPNTEPFVKDAFHYCVVNGVTCEVSTLRRGTKAAVHVRRTVPPGGEVVLRLRLTPERLERPFLHHNRIFHRRQEEADAFYAALQGDHMSPEDAAIQRQALAGMLWSKQLYYFDVGQWLRGDPAMPPPPPQRWHGRNADWEHLNNFDILSMPDKWEYPWYATWDLAFHCVPLALVDPDFAKRQLVLLTREWYMHPNGALPAYEWSFDDVNPPVHAWGAWEVYQLDARRTGTPDRAFLERVFHKLLLNFTWWVNREDEDGHNVFQGGFLGLDNISLFDRSHHLPTGGHVDQSDGTGWMGFYSLNMLQIALELAQENPVYQDVATKFFEHFLRIATAMNGFARRALSLWDEEDGFFYDALHLPDGSTHLLKVRSMVGLVPLFAVTTLEPDLLDRLGEFHRRSRWLMRNLPELTHTVACMQTPGQEERYLLSLVTRERLVRILRYVLDEEEFLSPYGIRSLSKAHRDPVEVVVDGQRFSVSYQPGESRDRVYGGNSNWRGPVWFPLNYLLIRALRRYHTYYGDDLVVEYPTGSGRWMPLDHVAEDLSRRLISLFRRDDQGRRPVFGDRTLFQQDPHWRDHLLFYEYFHGEHGAGLGASHQTGWTGLVASLLHEP